eukprot:TRINITY_DN33619_c0_g1_i1.p1 TRINITY_DN33619_c0_g1~~TRINITY_DN33619_c0_g1_i1.p1  ORF type:complete len:380 (-),score=35.10 TRINITY_DN33619_c0_g1_i1:273-1412(-)
MIAVACTLRAILVYVLLPWRLHADHLPAVCSSDNVEHSLRAHKPWPKNDRSTRALRSSGVYNVLLMRHGESIANTMDPFFVHSCLSDLACNHSYDPRDTALSAAGIALSRKQGKSDFLASLEPPDVVLVSPMLRTMQTAMNVLPHSWLQPVAKDRRPPKIFLLPWIQEVSAPSSSTRDGGVWAHRINQNWGHPPSQWFNDTCPADRPGASLDYNTSRATCVGYQGVKDWVMQYVDIHGYRGFYDKEAFDFWERKEASDWSPIGLEVDENLARLDRLLDGDLRDSKVMLVTHHQFLRKLISWPEASPTPDPFTGHIAPAFVCKDSSAVSSATLYPRVFLAADRTSAFIVGFLGTASLLFLAFRCSRPRSMRDRSSGLLER